MLLVDLHEKTKPGTYAGVTFSKETIDQLTSLQKSLGIDEPLAPSKFHTTLLYSSKHLPKYVAAGNLNPKPEADSCKYKLEIWPSNSGEKNVLVLKYSCTWLEDRHQFLMDEHGAKWDHPDYTPHITLSYNVGNWNGKKTVEFDTPITLQKEYQESLSD